MPEILPTGRFWSLDEGGFIVNDASEEKIHARYRPLLSEICDLYDKYLPELPIGIYLRGTVARGADFPGFSDLDDFALVEGEAINPSIPRSEVERLVRNHSEVSDVGLCTDGVRELGDGTRFSELAFLMTTQTTCIFGKDVISALPRYKPGVLAANNDISQIASDIEEAMRALETSSHDVAYWSRRISKNIIRCGFSLTMLDSPRFTRDLYPCYIAFSKAYPRMADEMRRTVEMSLSPTRSADDLASHLERFGGWMHDEASSWLSKYNPSGETEPLLEDFPDEVKFSRA